MDKKKLIIAGAVILALLLAAGGTYIAVSSAHSAKIREQINTLKLARGYMQSGEYTMALELVNKLLIDNADNEKALTLRDEIIRKKKAEEAAKAQEQLKAQKNLSQSLSKLGTDLQKTADTTAQKQEAARKKAELAKLDAQRKAAEERKKEEAKRLAQMSKAEKEKQAKVKALIDEGRQKMVEDQHVQARGFFDKALTLDPDSALAYAEKGESYFQEDENSQPNLNKAVEFAHKAIDKDKNLYLPYETLGKVYAKQNQWDNAIDAYKTASRLNPEDADLLFELGKAQYKAKRFDQARASFEACIHINPKHEKAYLNLGFTQRVLGSNVSAYRAFLNASRINPSNALAFFQMGELKRLAGDKKAAIENYTMAVSLDSQKAIYAASLGAEYALAKDYINA